MAKKSKKEEKKQKIAADEQKLSNLKFDSDTFKQDLALITAMNQKYEEKNKNINDILVDVEKMDNIYAGFTNKKQKEYLSTEKKQKIKKLFAEKMNKSKNENSNTSEKNKKDEQLNR